MRTKPLLGQRPWFGARSLGWGWAPVSWEGWVAVAVFVVLISEADSVFDGVARHLVTLLIVVAMVALCVVKGGAPGGGATVRRQFKGPRGANPNPDGPWAIKPGPRKIL